MPVLDAFLEKEADKLQVAMLPDAFTPDETPVSTSALRPEQNKAQASTVEAKYVLVSVTHAEVRSWVEELKSSITTAEAELQTVVAEQAETQNRKRERQLQRQREELEEKVLRAQVQLTPAEQHLPAQLEEWVKHQVHNYYQPRAARYPYVSMKLHQSLGVRGRGLMCKGLFWRTPGQPQHEFRYPGPSSLECFASAARCRLRLNTQTFRTSRYNLEGLFCLGVRVAGATFSATRARVRSSCASEAGLTDGTGAEVVVLVVFDDFVKMPIPGGPVVWEEALPGPYQGAAPRPEPGGEPPVRLQPRRQAAREPRPPDERPGGDHVARPVQSPGERKVR